MSLYVAKIRFKDQETIYEIPLRAQSEDEAIAYLNSSAEWIDDGSFNMVLHGEEYGIPCEWVEGKEGSKERKSKMARARQLFSVVGVVAILDPTQSPFRGDMGCWNGGGPMEDITVGAAFYDTLRSNAINDAGLDVTECMLYKLVKLEEDIVPIDEDQEKAWDAFSWFEKQLVKKFDLVRFDGMNLEQALLLANGSTAAVEVEPSKMRAAARVLAHEIENLPLHYRMKMDEINSPALN